MVSIVIAMYGGENAQLLHMAWIGALIFMFLLLAVAAAEFFLLDIPEAFALESGIAARKRLKQLNKRENQGNSKAFVIERDIVIVHTDERIDG